MDCFAGHKKEKKGLCPPVADYNKQKKRINSGTLSILSLHSL
jgi:hypothetical protein